MLNAHQPLIIECNGADPLAQMCSRCRILGSRLQLVRAVLLPLVPQPYPAVLAARHQLIAQLVDAVHVVRVTFQLLQQLPVFQAEPVHNVVAASGIDYVRDRVKQERVDDGLAQGVSDKIKLHVSLVNVLEIGRIKFMLSKTVHTL